MSVDSFISGFWIEAITRRPHRILSIRYLPRRARLVYPEQTERDI